jgi:hypothetical protein
MILLQAEIGKSLSVLFLENCYDQRLLSMRAHGGPLADRNDPGSLPTRETRWAFSINRRQARSHVRASPHTPIPPCRLWFHKIITGLFSALERCSPEDMVKRELRALVL